MRLDKFIASLRILKSRSLAKTAADEGMIFLNGAAARASATVQIDDIIEIDIPRFYKKIRVVRMLSKSVKKSERSEFYDLLEDRKKSLS